MSADRWTVCPRCGVEREVKLAKAYGKVSAEEYSEMVTSDESEETLREDREIGIFHGVFRVDFSAYCDNCAFSFSFKHKETLKP